MSGTFVWATGGFFFLSLVLVVAHGVLGGGGRRMLVELFILAIILGALYWTTGFPFATERTAFGGEYSPGLALILMFIGVVAGIASNVFFNSTEKPTFISFAKPVVVAPIVMLPLIGSMQGAALELVQLVSISFLSFQNGFFWREVLKNVRVSDH
jgi:hypothetical protein